MTLLLLILIVLVIGYLVGRSKYRKNIDDTVSGAANWTSNQVKRVTGGSGSTADEDAAEQENEPGPEEE
jgi:hypothetical protein